MNVLASSFLFVSAPSIVAIASVRFRLVFRLRSALTALVRLSRSPHSNLKYFMVCNFRPQSI